MAATQPIVVVGAGTAGCTVISYLASHTDRPILVLEPGRTSHHDDVSQFLDVLASGLVTTTTDGYFQAKVLGGGSAVNGMLLTGDEPEHLRGLTRMATNDDIGFVGQSLLADGGRFSRLWWNGGRWNPGRAVAHLVDEGRVRLLPRTVTKLLHENGNVHGVDCGGESIAASVVVLCAGAIATPAILLRSGLADLNSHIGDGLQNHPTATATFVHDESLAHFDAGVVREWVTDGGGQMLNIAYERASSFDPDLGMLSVSLMNPQSRGHVSLDSVGEPISDFCFLSEESDILNMDAGVRDLMRLLREGTYSSHAESISVEGTSLAEMDRLSTKEFREWILGHVQGVSHASSSCADAVDDHGRLKGVKNCWIADASVLAVVPSCTPAAPVTMEAMRIAHHLGESLS